MHNNKCGLPTTNICILLHREGARAKQRRPGHHAHPTFCYQCNAQATLLPCDTFKVHCSYKADPEANFPSCILPVLALGVHAQNAGGQLKVDPLTIPIERTATMLSSSTGPHNMASWDPIVSVCQALLAAARTADEPW
jgi:hypothetical protein